MKLDLSMSSRVSFKCCSWKFLWISFKPVRLRDKFCIFSWNEVCDKTGYVKTKYTVINNLIFTNNEFVTNAIRIGYDLSLIKCNITHMIYVLGCHITEVQFMSCCYRSLETPSLLDKQKMNNYVVVISHIRSYVNTFDGRSVLCPTGRVNYRTTVRWW